jgi:hypothetical protein
MARIGVRPGGLQNASTAAGEVEGCRVNVGEHRRRSGAQNGADRGEEAERRGDDRVAGADSGGSQRQPQGVGADEQPSAWATPSWLPPARSKAATGSPRMNCCVSSTCSKRFQ